jgi:hypothetical protein
MLTVTRSWKAYTANKLGSEHQYHALGRRRLSISIMSILPLKISLPHSRLSVEDAATSRSDDGVVAESHKLDVKDATLVSLTRPTETA